MRNKLIGVLVVLAALVAGCSPAAAPVTAVVQAQEGQESSAGLAPRAAADKGAPPLEIEQEAATEAAAEAPMPDVFMPAPTAASAVTQEPVQNEPPQDMYFQEYGTNPFVITSKDNLSTFAVDVDTGSYTLTRSYLNDGNLPPPEAIRLEEFVNYFRQDYPVPQDQAFLIDTEAARTPFSAQDSYVLRVGLQGYEIPDSARPDAQLIFVIDVSGSMNEDNRLGAVKQALNMLVNSLRPTDKIGIVVYGSQGRVVLEPTEIGQTGEIRDAINSLEPDGSTNAEEGLRLAYEMASANYDPNRINRLILCSDGVANVGITGPDAILETVRQQANEGITLTTVGFGMGNYNDVLMEQLANDGDGQYYYADSAKEAERLFVTDLTGTLQTIALNAKIQVEFNGETVEAYRLMGYENRAVADQDFRNNAVDAGEIGAGHSVTALYEIIPTQNTQGTVATVRVRWEDPTTHDVQEIEHSIAAGEVHTSFEQASPRYQLDVLAAAFADVLGQGAWAQNASYDSILAASAPVAAVLNQDADVLEFVALVQRAKSLAH